MHCFFVSFLLLRGREELTQVDVYQFGASMVYQNIMCVAVTQTNNVTHNRIGSNRMGVIEPFRVPLRGVGELLEEEVVEDEV